MRRLSRFESDLTPVFDRRRNELQDEQGVDANEAKHHHQTLPFSRQPIYESGEQLHSPLRHRQLWRGLVVGSALATS